MANRPAGHCLTRFPGRVCVPVDPAHVDDFDPESVPTVGELLQELNNVPNAESGVEHHSGGSFALTSRPSDNKLAFRLGTYLIETLRGDAGATCFHYHE